MKTKSKAINMQRNVVVPAMLGAALVVALIIFTRSTSECVHLVNCWHTVVAYLH